MEEHICPHCKIHKGKILQEYKDYFLMWCSKCQKTFAAKRTGEMRNSP